MMNMRKFNDMYNTITSLLPLKKRFTPDERKELSRIREKVDRKLLKQPQYIIGYSLETILCLYFFYKAVCPQYDWVYFLYVVLILFGSVCLFDSVRKHHCETLLRLKQHPERIADI